MKIAFLCHNIFTDGGVQRVVTTLSNLLSKEHQIDIICTNTKTKIDYTKYGLSKNIRVIFKTFDESNKIKKSVLRSLRALNLYTNLFNNKFLYKFLARIYYPCKQREKLVDMVNKNQYDIIVGCEGYYAILLGIIQHQINAKTVSWIHNSYEAYLETKYKYCWNRETLLKKYLTKVSKNVVLTKIDEKKFFEKLNIKSQAIYNPLSFRVNEKADLRSNVIISVGRLATAKGFDNLIKSFRIANEKCKEKWELWIVGDGEEKENLSAIVDKYKINKYVVFKPFTKEIPKELSKASIYAMSSRWEGFGLVVLEALEVGLPIVSFQVSGPQEILEGYNCAIMVENNNINNFADGLYSLMNDFNKRKCLSQNGLERVEFFSGERIVSEWNEMLRGIK